MMTIMPDKSQFNCQAQTKCAAVSRAASGGSGEGPQTGLALVNAPPVEEGFDFDREIRLK